MGFSTDGTYSDADGRPYRVLVLQADVADPDALARAADELGQIDVLVINAAVVQPVGPTLTASPTAWASAFAVKVDAAFHEQHGIR